MELTYFGHSAFQIRGPKTLLFDPFISGNPLANGIVSASDLNPDVILVTHAHGDHWGDTLAILKRTGAMLVANYEIVTYAQQHGYDNAHALNTGGAWRFDWGWVKQTYARHSSSFPDGTYGGNPNGYVLEIEGCCIYYAGDTDPFVEMGWIGEDHDIDVALLPVGDCFTMGPKDAIRAATLLKPGVTIPVHHTTFPFIEVNTAAWAAKMEALGHPARVLAPGESMLL